MLGPRRVFWMLIYAYLFALVVGGVLLGASVLLGGHDGVGEHSADGDAGGADASADLDGDLDGDASGFGHDLDHSLSTDNHGGLEHDIGVGADFLLWSLTSIRFWTFFLAFFGLTGLSLEGLGLIDNSTVTLGLAIMTGLITGYGAAGVIRWLSRDTSGTAATSADYVGKSVRVVVPVKAGHTGKVRLELKGQLVDVLAFADDDENFASKDEAMIIEMDGTRARIARADEPRGRS